MSVRQSAKTAKSVGDNGVQRSHISLVTGAIFAMAAMAPGCAIDQKTQDNDPFDIGSGTGGFIKPDIQIDTAGPQDAGSTDTAGGSSGGSADTSAPAADSAGSADTGAGAVDAGSGLEDAGSAVEDTTSQPQDAGEATDSATGPEDTASQPEDTTEPDAGQPDTGPEDTGPAGCKAADPKSCDDNKPCTQDVCDEPTGQCAHIPLPSGTPCDGGFLCSASVCQPNVGCVASGEKKKCDDGKPCTLDECVEGKGCVSKDGGNAACDDGDACTKFDHCKAGKCSGTKDTCNDGWACTKDECVAGKGCKHEIQLSGPCDDNNACTKSTECVNGDCKGPDIPCDDGNSCTKDLCDPKVGCKYEKLDKIVCDDGDACTIKNVCNAGKCTGDKRDCGDGKSCTEDLCDAKTGCANKLLKEGSACLLGGTCSKGVCSSMLSCGNGKVDKGEICDDGNKNPCDNCNNTCSGSGQGQKLSGTALIGNGGSYKTIGQAISALKSCGVQGPTRFVVLPGTYKESGFDLPNIATASPKAPITFQADPTGKVKLVGTVSGSSYTGTVRFMSGAHDYTVEGFDFDGKEPANKLKSSHCAALVFQPGTAQQRITIRGNNIHDYNSGAFTSYQYVGAIYLPSMSKEYVDIHIEGNRFTNLSPSSASYSRQGVIFSYYPRINGLRITGNYFAGNQMYAQLSFYYGYKFSNVLIANNMMHVQYRYGTYLYRTTGVSNNAYYAFNTILMTASASYGIYAYYWNYNGSNKTQLVFRNNIIASTSGTKKSVYAYPQSTDFSLSGNNCLFNAQWDYQGSGNVTGNPDFKSLNQPYDLHIGKASACANKGSLDVPGVTHDFDGDPRGDTPDIGADEIP